MYDPKNNINDVVDTIIKKQLNILLKRLDKTLNRDHTKIEWIKENPGAQLTGSFNPINIKPKDWYGKYLI